MLPTDSTVAILNDPTNGGRAGVAAASGRPSDAERGARVRASALDFVDNPKNLKIKELMRRHFLAY